LKFGAEWKPRVDFTVLQPPFPRGRFNFSGDFTRDPNDRSGTGLGFADFLLGRVTSSLVGSFINDTFQQPGNIFYAQDDIKLTRKLTLNLGVRYEFISMPRERRDAQANFNLATGQAAVLKLAAAAIDQIDQSACFPEDHKLSQQTWCDLRRRNGNFACAKRITPRSRPTSSVAMRRPRP
jgi:outer membrane receptor protein involved in Fe transport